MQSKRRLSPKNKSTLRSPHSDSLEVSSHFNPTTLFPSIDTKQHRKPTSKNPDPIATHFQGFDLNSARIWTTKSTPASISVFKSTCHVLSESHHSPVFLLACSHSAFLYNYVRVVIFSFQNFRISFFICYAMIITLHLHLLHAYMVEIHLMR